MYIQIHMYACMYVCIHVYAYTLTVAKYAHTVEIM